MIRCELLANAWKYPEFEEVYRKLLPDDFFTSAAGSAAGYFVLEDDQPIAYASQRKLSAQETGIDVQFCGRVAYESKVRCISFLTERAIKIHKPQRITCRYAGGNAAKAMNACMYYRKGTGYQRLLEPMRALIPNAAFDQEGMIINQGLTQQVPFGWFDSKAKGCGWIAAYNLLKILGREMTMQECKEGLEKNAILGQVMGQNEVLLQLWLHKQGIKVHRSLPSDTLTNYLIPRSRAGILLYNHRSGAHYAAYRVLKGGRIQLYNAVYGKTDHIVSADAFLKEHAVFRVSSVLYVK